MCCLLYVDVPVVYHIKLRGEDNVRTRSVPGCVTGQPSGCPTGCPDSQLHNRKCEIALPGSLLLTRRTREGQPKTRYVTMYMYSTLEQCILSFLIKALCAPTGHPSHPFLIKAHCAVQVAKGIVPALCRYTCCLSQQAEGRRQR